MEPLSQSDTLVRSNPLPVGEDADPAVSAESRPTYRVVKALPTSGEPMKPVAPDPGKSPNKYELSRNWGEHCHWQRLETYLSGRWDRTSDENPARARGRGLDAQPPQGGRKPEAPL